MVWLFLFLETPTNASSRQSHSSALSPAADGVHPPPPVGRQRLPAEVTAVQAPCGRSSTLVIPFPRSLSHIPSRCPDCSGDAPTRIGPTPRTRCPSFALAPPPPPYDPLWDFPGTPARLLPLPDGNGARLQPLSEGHRSPIGRGGDSHTRQGSCRAGHSRPVQNGQDSEGLPACAPCALMTRWVMRLDSAPGKKENTTQ